MSRPILVSIEGNIGSGKTTLVAELKKRNPTWRFVDEPVGSWMSFKDERGISLLGNFYEDKRRWAYTFQTTALLTRLDATQKAVEEWRHDALDTKTPQVFITERCVDTDFNVFAKLMSKSGDMNEMETDLYNKWFHVFASTSLRPTAYIHVDTPAEICEHRIKRRARSGEESIPLAYLRDLEHAHKEWLSPKDSVFSYDNYTNLAHTVSDVEDFIHALS